MAFVVEDCDDSALLFVESLNLSIVTPKILMNLFCCFGNLDRLLIDPVTTSALIQFRYRTEALEALNSLNELSFFSQELRISICSNQRLKFREDVLTSRTQVISLKGDHNFYRFQNTLNIKYNPPSSVLHFTSLSERCDPVILFELIRQINELRKIIKLVQRGNKGSLMYLVEFATIDAAIEVLAVLHNKIVDGKSMKVSFSVRR
jgi:hypothetical protein